MFLNADIPRIRIINLPVSESLQNILQKNEISFVKNDDFLFFTGLFHFFLKKALQKKENTAII